MRVVGFGRRFSTDSVRSAAHAPPSSPRRIINSTPSAAVSHRRTDRQTPYLDCNRQRATRSLTVLVTALQTD